MDKKIKYNVNTIIKTNVKDEKEITEIFNRKLLKLIFFFECGKYVLEY